MRNLLCVLLLALISCEIPQPVPPIGADLVSDAAQTVDAAPIVTAYRLTPYKTKYTTSETSFTQQTDGIFWDSQLQVRCYLLTASDGLQRCLPFLQAPIFGYLDSACTQPLTYTNSCNLLRYAYNSITVGCNGGYDIHSVLNKITTPTIIYGKSGTMCISGTATSGVDYYRVGPPLPPSTFVAVQTEQVP